MTTPPRPPRPRHRRSDASLLADLFTERADLTTIATRHAMSLKLLAVWAQRPRITQLLAALIHLADDRADLALARARADAAHAMRRLATSDSDPDLARKAGLDLLKLPRKPARDPDNLPSAADLLSSTNPARTFDHDALRALLESAGAHSDPASDPSSPPHQDHQP